MRFKNRYVIVILGVILAWGFATVRLPLSVLMVWLVFFGVNQHVSLGLIQLEVLTIVARLALIINSRLAVLNVRFILILFSVGVIEAALGLSLLALASRSQRLELFKIVF